MSDDENDISVPRAVINKVIKEILPNIRVANETRELLLNCCSEFIHLLSTESNEICNTQQKKTISPEHVLLALERIGFGDYRSEAEEVVSEYKNIVAKRRRQSTRLEHLGIPEEELFRQQQELFAKAREAHQPYGNVTFSVMPQIAIPPKQNNGGNESDDEDYS